MEILSGLSDNQAALAMCGAALLTCAFIMSLSYYIGGGRTSPEVQAVETVEPPVADGSVPPQRKAA